MRDTLPLLDKIPFRDPPRQGWKRCRSMLAIAAISRASIAMSTPALVEPRR
jgi:hypothetical protein